MTSYTNNPRDHRGRPAVLTDEQLFERYPRMTKDKLERIQKADRQRKAQEDRDITEAKRCLAAEGSNPGTLWEGLYRSIAMEDFLRWDVDPEKQAGDWSGWFIGGSAEEEKGA